MPAVSRPGPAHAARVSWLGRIVTRFRHRGLTPDREARTGETGRGLTHVPTGTQARGKGRR